uniref:Trans-1,2-dihydrobenzene-1,2-diol dehydrogenase n=1 Tax=Pundamilia nyererei TaxID=303518 RepID=A0A3B4G1Q5_9CICH
MATRWGLCGAGKISHDFSVAIKTLPPGDHQVRNINKLSAAAYEELANDPEIDIVYLGMLHTEHWRVGMLFLKAGKNVLCEKPFAMNSREVKDLVATAKKNHVFLMEAIWSRCFHVYAEVRRLLAEEAVGDVKLVKAYFGSPQLDIPRSVQKELGGGALLDIGVYCLQFVLMVFNGERPESIQATGVLLDSGMIQIISQNITVLLLLLLIIIYIIFIFLPSHKLQFILNMYIIYTYYNLTSLHDPRMPLADSVLLTEIMAEIRKQVGVVFNQDSQ